MFSVAHLPHFSNRINQNDVLVCAFQVETFYYKMSSALICGFTAVTLLELASMSTRSGNGLLFVLKIQFTICDIRWILLIKIYKKDACSYSFSAMFVFRCLVCWNKLNKYGEKPGLALIVLVLAFLFIFHSLPAILAFNSLTFQVGEIVCSNEIWNVSDSLLTTINPYLLVIFDRSVRHEIWTVATLRIFRRASLKRLHSSGFALRDLVTSDGRTERGPSAILHWPLHCFSASPKANLSLGLWIPPFRSLDKLLYCSYKICTRCSRTIRNLILS